MEKMPDFVLLDWEGGNPQPAWEETATKFQATIIPVTNIQSVIHKNICLFILPSENSGDKMFIVRFMRANKILNSFNIHNYFVETTPFKISSRILTPIPGFVADRFSKICTVYNALDDEESKDTFLRLLKALELGQAGYRPIARYPEYAHPLVDASPGDMVIDGGLWTATTILAFCKKIGDKGRVVGFEPVHKFAEEIKSKCKGYSNVQILEYGLWSENMTSYIEMKSVGGSRLTNHQGKNVEACRLISIDNYLKSDRDFRCGLVKLDIEGAEIECLKGAAETIRRFTPKLQISIYHEPNHCIDIPLMLIQMKLGYKFYIGHHTPWFWETCLYALPPGKSQPEERKKPQPTLALRACAWSAKAANTVSLFIQRKVIEKSGMFDAAWYVKQYPDLTPAGRRDPLKHYLRTGWRQGKNPSPYFISSLYLEINKVPHGLCPLFHYIVSRG
jgi:FkbM family methyltransferase